MDKELQQNKVTNETNLCETEKHFFLMFLGSILSLMVDKPSQDDHSEHYCVVVILHFYLLVHTLFQILQLQIVFLIHKRLLHKGS